MFNVHSVHLLGIQRVAIFDETPDRQAFQVELDEKTYSYLTVQWCNHNNDDSHLNTIDGKWSWFRQNPFAKTEQIPLQRSSDLPIFMSGISISSM